MKIDEASVIKKNKNVISRVIGNETILLPMYKTSDEINCIYTLNKAAAWVWEKIDNKTTPEVIKNRILKEFDVSPVQAAKALKSLLEDLAEAKAIVV